MCHVTFMHAETTNHSNIILIRSDMTGQVEGIYAIIEERLQYIYTCTSCIPGTTFVTVSLSWLPIIQIVQIHAITIGVKNTKQ